MRPRRCTLALAAVVLVACSAASSDSNISTYLSTRYERAESMARDSKGSVAGVMQQVRKSLPAPSFSIDLNDPGSSVTADTLRSFFLGLAKIAGAGLALGVIAAVVGVFFMPCRCCFECCRRGRIEKRRAKDASYVPSPVSPGLYVSTVVFALVLTGIIIFGCAVSLRANNKFSDSVTLIAQLTIGTGDAVVNIGDDVLGFIDHIVPHVEPLIASGSALLDKIDNVTAPCDLIMADLHNASSDLNAAAAKLSALPAVTPQLSSLGKNISSSVRTATARLSDVDEILRMIRSDISQWANKSRSDSQKVLQEAKGLTASARSQANAYIGNITVTVDDVHDYSQMVTKYDKIRYGVILALLCVPFVALVMAYAGFFSKRKWVVLSAMGVGFFVVATLMVIGSLHLAASVAVTTVCHDVEKDKLPSKYRNVLTQCGNGSSIFVALNKTQNLDSSSVVPTQEIDQFANFTQSKLDTSRLEEFIHQINKVASLDIDVNSTTAAATLGYNFSSGSPEAEEAYRLEQFNNVSNTFCMYPQCEGVVYTEENYTSFNMSLYAPSARPALQKALDGISKVVEAKRAIQSYIANVTEIEHLLKQLNSTAMLALQHFRLFNHTIMTFIDVDFKAFKDQIAGFVAFVDSVNSIGECQFVPLSVDSVNVTACTTALHHMDVLSLGCCCAGLFTLPAIVVFEVMMRIARRKDERKTLKAMSISSDEEKMPKKPLEMELISTGETGNVSRKDSSASDVPLVGSKHSSVCEVPSPPPESPPPVSPDVEGEGKYSAAGNALGDGYVAAYQPRKNSELAQSFLPTYKGFVAVPPSPEHPGSRSGSVCSESPLLPQSRNSVPFPESHSPLAVSQDLPPYNTSDGYQVQELPVTDTPPAMAVQMGSEPPPQDLGELRAQVPAEIMFRPATQYEPPAVALEPPKLGDNIEESTDSIVEVEQGGYEFGGFTPIAIEQEGPVRPNVGGDEPLQ
eukprot:m51a1_g13981 hypothetical protein (968) ;mRNA; r:1009981-1013454